MVMDKVEMNKVINYFTYKYDGDWDSIYDAIQNKERIDINDLENFSDKNEEIKYISIIDQDYPDNFKTIYMPPLTIYYEGNKELLYGNNIISLFGNLDKESFKKIFNNKNVYAMEFNQNNFEIVQKMRDINPKVIFVDYQSYNKQAIRGIDKTSMVYISEIPCGAKHNIQQQKKERFLLGVSNTSIFINSNDIEFKKYKEISMFEKRKMMVSGNYNNDYLTCATKYN